MTSQTIYLPGQFDVSGRLKVGLSQNIYDADFEYGTQPLRWESLTGTGGTIVHTPQTSGAVMSVTTASGSFAIRQSRPYMRYQPGKTMYVATAQLFGLPIVNQVHRVGFYDDTNGCFFEQDGTGMWAVIRSDTSGVITETRVPQSQWTGDRIVAGETDWNRIQMVWIEYAWYGAGTIRWGIIRNGRPIVLHEYSHGNAAGAALPWCRTGNLPVRYEIRNTGASTAASILHYGVSVLVEGRADDQRGFTYSYGMAPASPRRNVPATSTRFPVLSIRGRTMGTIEATQAGGAVTAGTTTSITVAGTPWTVNQWRGRYVFFPGLGAAGTGTIARITANTANTLTFMDMVTGGPVGVAPAASANYQIGLVNRGQFLPRRLLVSSDGLATVELIASTPTSPVALTGAAFASLSTLGSANSFAERDITATGSVTGGEVVFAFSAPAGGSGLQDLDLSNLFPLMNTIRGNSPDTLTVAVTTGAAAVNVGAHLICQEAMS